MHLVGDPFVNPLMHLVAHRTLLVPVGEGGRLRALPDFHDLRLAQRNVRNHPDGPIVRRRFRGPLRQILVLHPGDTSAAGNRFSVPLVPVSIWVEKNHHLAVIQKMFNNRHQSLLCNSNVTASNSI